MQRMPPHWTRAEARVPLPIHMGRNKMIQEYFTAPPGKAEVEKLLK